MLKLNKIQFLLSMNEYFLQEQYETQSPCLFFNILHSSFLLVFHQQLVFYFSDEKPTCLPSFMSTTNRLRWLWLCRFQNLNTWIFNLIKMIKKITTQKQFSKLNLVSFQIKSLRAFEHATTHHRLIQHSFHAS